MPEGEKSICRGFAMQVNSAQRVQGWRRGWQAQQLG